MGGGPRQSMLPISSTRPVGETRDELDRHFTPMPLAQLICRELVADVRELGVVDRWWPRLIVEPSVGGGAFARAGRSTWSGAHITGVDIDPAAEGKSDVDEFVLGDWTQLDWTPDSVDLALGNPPFSGTKAIPHVECALRAADVVAFILPWGPLGGVEAWDHLMVSPDRPALVRPIAPRPWGDHIRETALYVYVRGHEGDTIVRHLPRWK